MTAPIEASVSDYEDIVGAVLTDISAAFFGLDFNFKVEFLDRSTAQIELLIVEDGGSRRVASHLSPATRERIFLRRKDLYDRGFHLWQSMTISARAHEQPSLNLIYPSQSGFSDLSGV
jgi:hypothetical protein